MSPHGLQRAVKGRPEERSGSLGADSSQGHTGCPRGAGLAQAMRRCESGPMKMPHLPSEVTPYTSVLVFYHCSTNYQQLGSFKEHIYHLTVSVGQDPGL